MTQPKFVPKPGQVDYSHIRYAPVINIVVIHNGKILLAKRSPGLKLYPNLWNGISGFLDDNHDIEDKVYEELSEELGLDKSKIELLTIARPIREEAPDRGKTWLILPVSVQITTTDIQTDWEAAEVHWFSPDEVGKLDLVPGFHAVLAEFFPGLR